MSIAQIILMLLEYSARLYVKTQKKFPNVLPNLFKITNNPKSPFTKFLMKLRIYALGDNFEPIVKNELIFFMKNRKEVGGAKIIKVMGNILSLLKKTEGIKGDVIELGIASGATTIMMAHFLKQINSKRKIYGCDTFEGLPYEDTFSKQSSKNLIGEFSHSLDFVHDKSKKFNVYDKVILVQVHFEDTLYFAQSNINFSYVLFVIYLYVLT